MTLDTTSKTSSSPGGLRLEEASAQILDCLGAAVVVVDRRQVILYQNTLAASWLPDGVDLESVFAEARFLGPFDGWSAVQDRILDAGEVFHCECALPLPGRPSPGLVTVHCTPLREPGSERTDGVVILLQEIPFQGAIEPKLEVSKRLTSLGKLATRVAHELNNPLDGILRYTNLALRLAEETPHSKLQSYLSESRTGLMRIVQIIGDLLEFSRATHGEFDALTINEVVEEAIKSVTSAADTGRVIVAADFQNQEMPTACGSRLYQVCCNLIKNAIDAMPDGGRLSITTGIVDGHVIIEVADTGVGLPDAVEKVFEPFFTTKEPGKGTGLGLAICKDFVEDMRGTITAAPGEGGGAVFCVRIPLSSFGGPMRLSATPRDHSHTASLDA